ncbi:MAG: Glucose/sorbosone dehydrogenase-like protein, partial [Candidatus Giovannonibacteria bacterium GW2011_GWA1_43_15]
CDVCDEKDQRRAKILSVNYDGADLKTFASGLRNSVFMAIHPVAGKVWATEMGRDFLGDNLPPDEINIIEEGKYYGWPYFYGKGIRDAAFEPDVMFEQDPDRVGSYIDIPAHSAPLGLAFIPEEGWPQDWWYNLLVAYHGSWNKADPTGYKIARYKLDAEGRRRRALSRRRRFCFRLAYEGRSAWPSGGYSGGTRRNHLCLRRQSGSDL